MQLQPLLLRKIIPLSIIMLIIPLTSCRVQKEESGRLPDVNVDVESGQLPKYDIQGPDVEVGVEKRTVTVPKVMLVQEQETVDVPYIDVDVPGAERQERTIKTEVEVPSGGYDVEIQSIYAQDNQLWVISQLQEENPNAINKRMRISDRVIVNSPDIPVRKYIIGSNPASSDNAEYNFISSREQIATELNSAKLLYQK